MRALWLAAMVVAALGAWICFDALPGLSWGLWTLAAASGLAAFAWRAGKEEGQTILGLAALAVVIAFGAMLTANPAFHALILVTAAGVLAVATLLAAGGVWTRIGLPFVLTAPPVALFRSLAETARRAGEALSAVRGDRSLPVLRGLVITLPVLAIFALLLSSADPVLDSTLGAIGRALETLHFLPRLIFFGALAVIVLGAYGLAVRPAVTAPQPAPARKAPAVLLGDTERLMVLGSVAVLFAAFLLLQLSYLFGNSPAVRGSGVTFAEYARRGFGELTVVATLCTLLILALDRFARPGARAARVRLVELALVAELQLLLASAMHRVNLYEAAYGFTTARLYAQAYMVVVSLTLLLLAWEIWAGIDGARLTRRIAVLGTLTVGSLSYWNHEAWIARKNIERFRETGKVDLRYLATGLSLNAVPEVVRVLPELPADSAAALRWHLNASNHHRAEALQWRWFEWNPRRAAGIAALRRVGIDVTRLPEGPPPGRLGVRVAPNGASAPSTTPLATPPAGTEPTTAPLRTPAASDSPSSTPGATNDRPQRSP